MDSKWDAHLAILSAAIYVKSTVLEMKKKSWATYKSICALVYFIQLVSRDRLLCPRSRLALRKHQALPSRLIEEEVNLCPAFVPEAPSCHNTLLDVMTAQILATQHPHGTSPESATLCFKALAQLIFSMEKHKPQRPGPTRAATNQPLP